MVDNVDIPQDLTLSSHYALRVALQTMKERCISLQHRLTIVEEENSELKNRIEIDFPSNLSEQSELKELRKQVTDLLQQKLQLNEHISMVATENRQLWSRLSHLSKDRQKNTTDIENKINSSSAQNLIRSKTFTQHSPNPNLRHKNIDATSDDLSLEEVELINYFENKVNHSDKELVDNGILKKNSLGFGFLHDETHTGESEIIIDSRKCIDGIQEMKRTLLKQQNDLKQVLYQLQNKIPLQECEDCKKLKKPETADKSLETDESLIEGHINNSRTLPGSKSTSENQTNFPGNVEAGSMNLSHGHVDILREKRLADETNHICPICGIGKTSDNFDDFLNHVESHFKDENSLDDNTLDSNQIEHNFEMVSHTVGDF